MPDYTVHILRLREDNYHNGLKLGRRLRNQPILKAFEAVTKPEIDTEQLKSIYNEFAPRCYQSLKGWRKDWKCLFQSGGASRRI